MARAKELATFGGSLELARCYVKPLQGHVDQGCMFSFSVGSEIACMGQRLSNYVVSLTMSGRVDTRDHAKQRAKVEELSGLDF